MTKRVVDPGRRLVLAAAVVLSAMAAPALANTGGPVWQPQVTERLVKLPATALDRTIAREFEASSLGAELRRVATEMTARLAALGDLHAVIESGSGSDTGEVRHRFLVEKQAYIQLAAERNQLRQQELRIRQGLLDRLLAKIDDNEAALGVARRELIAQQQAARERVQATIARVDDSLLKSTVGAESRYAREHGEKAAAIARLQQAIADHGMNAEPVIDGETVTKADYVRHLIAASEGELALLAMEDEMLGYMARLAALDALELAEAVRDPELADSDVAEPADVTRAVDFFVVN